MDVAEWVGSMVDRHLAIATIRRRLAAVGWAFELVGRTPPTRSRAVRQVVAGAAPGARHRPTPRRAAAARPGSPPRGRSADRHRPPRRPQLTGAPRPGAGP